MRLRSEAIDTGPIVAPRDILTATADGPDGLRTDAQLLADARRDAAAFAELYDRHVDRIYRYCFARLHARESAEDATATTFFRALSGLASYRGGSVIAWLVVIARNATTDALRGRRRELGIEAAAAVEDAALTPEDRAVANAERAALRSALARLSKDQRTAIDLQLAGWSLAESAQAMNRSVAAIKMLRARAVAHLQQQLEHFTGKDGSST